MPEILSYLWKINPAGYACRYTKAEGTVRMHRQIMGLGLGDPREVDHVNRDQLDNRRENLRIVTRAQNLQNRSSRGNRNSKSGIRGVRLCKQTGRWAASAVINYETHWLGRHDTKEQAEAAVREFRAQHMPYSQEDQAA